MALCKLRAVLVSNLPQTIQVQRLSRVVKEQVLQIPKILKMVFVLSEQVDPHVRKMIPGS